MRQTWSALDENVRACVNQYLQLGGQNIDVLVQQGIPSTDPRLGSYLSECNVVSSVRLLKGKPCVVEGVQTMCNEVFVYTSAPISPLGPEQLAAAVVAKRAQRQNLTPRPVKNEQHNVLPLRAVHRGEQ